MSGVPSIRLLLVTRRGPSGVASDQREVTRIPFSIGRAAENDWAMPDPDRVMSKRHCRITADGETWLITDTSSNGTFLNGTALEYDVPRALRDDDRVVTGAYEIQARLGDGHDPEPRSMQRDARILETGPANEGDPEDRLTSDPFSSLDSDVMEVARRSVGLPSNFDPMTQADRVAEGPYAASDHVPELEANFRAPRSSAELLPEDWNQAPEPRPASKAEPPTPTPAPAPPMPAPGAQIAASAPPPVAGTDDAAGFAAFASGAGMPGTSVAEPNATLSALGAAFRVVVSGLRSIMIARATIKGEFRIGQTVIRASGNNPLKFSADDNDALAALLGAGRQAGIRPAQAIGEAMRDIRRHELAVVVAMQHAVCSVLAELEPARVMQNEQPTRLDQFLGGHERRAWQRYTALHERMMRALADDFDSVFGRAFARAYEAALSDIAAQDSEQY
jgi:type VI secretion system FHA domain protein